MHACRQQGHVLNRPWHATQAPTNNHPPAAGFELPGEYQAPALGKVRRPGSDVVEDIPTRPEDEEDVPAYYDEVDVEA